MKLRRLREKLVFEEVRSGWAAQSMAGMVPLFLDYFGRQGAKGYLHNLGVATLFSYPR
jgi:hypothetical protein